MNENDPYSPPEAPVYMNLDTNNRFHGMDFNQLKKLYYRSCNVNTINFLLGIGLMVVVIVSILPEANFLPAVRFFLIGLAVFYAIAVTGIYRRTSWGRILGIIVCIITLLNFPIGTLIGACGLFAFFGAPELFGANRITHKELKAEFNIQKAAQKKK